MGKWNPTPAVLDPRGIHINEATLSFLFSLIVFLPLPLGEKEVLRCQSSTISVCVGVCVEINTHSAIHCVIHISAMSQVVQQKLR